MFRNLILATLASLIILSGGCYDSVILNSDQASRALSSEKVTVFVAEDDGTTGQYQTTKGACWIRNDTLFGRAGITSDSGVLAPAHLKVPISKIKYFEVEELNAGKTILLTAGIVGVTAGLIAILSNANEESSPPPQPVGNTQFSCPLIYSLGDFDYKLESETFAGAVFKGVEKTSYDVLNYLKPVNGFYRIRLVNARQETEYVNELKLIVVDHSPAVSVIPDFIGRIHTITKLVRPFGVYDKEGHDLTTVLDKIDGHYWESNLNTVDVHKKGDLVDYITASFSKPPHAQNVKIVVSGLNTKLAYFALEKIFAFQGSLGMNWYNKLDSDSTERARFIGWLMREGMLHISVWDGTKWSERSAIQDVGPGVEKTQITILNVADIQDDTLKVRFSFRTGLWRLDRIAVDYSPDSPVRICKLTSDSAKNEKGLDISNLISESDLAYYVTICGEYANIRFTVPPKNPELARTVIAKTRGFYNQWSTPVKNPQPKVVERILNEPLYGSKLLIPLWLKENAKKKKITKVENE